MANPSSTRHESIEDGHLLFGLTESRTVGTGPTTLISADSFEKDSRIDYSGIESEAEDDLRERASESSVKHLDEQSASGEDMQVDNLPVLEMPSGRILLRLTELYAPLHAIQDMRYTLDRTRHSKKDNEKQRDEYLDYLSNLRAYKQSLFKKYISISQRNQYRVNTIPATDLSHTTDLYYKKSLLSELRRIERELSDMKARVHPGSAPPPTSAASRAFYGILNSDFRQELLLGGPSKVSKLSYNERPILVPSQSLTSRDKLITKNNAIWYINDNSKEGLIKEKQNDFSEMFAGSGDVFGPGFGTSVGYAVPAHFAPIELGAHKGVQPPGLIEDFGKNPLAQVTPTEFWGELAESKTVYEDDNFVGVPSHLFSIEILHEVNDFPTNLNRELRDSPWEQLAYLERPTAFLQALHSSYSRRFLNMNDESMHLLPAAAPPPALQGEHEARSVTEPSKEERSLSELTSSRPPQEHERPILATSVMLKHSLPASEYPFLKTEWCKEELRHFHRPDLSTVLPVDPWKIDLGKHFTVPDIPLKESRTEDITAYLSLKSGRQLSIREGPFALIEFIEQRPPLINNYGMGSKIRKFYKGAKDSREYPSYLGDLGTSERLGTNENIPLIAQLKENQGITITDNNLFRAPLYAHTARKHEFLLIRYTSKKGRSKFYVRPIDYLYTCAQIEPKVEVFAPNARSTNQFQQKRKQALIHKALLEAGNKATIQDILRGFPKMTESGMRKELRSMKCEQNREGDWMCSELPNDNEIKEIVTPELLCQFESMLSCQRTLKDKGIHLTSIDKVPNAIQKLLNEVETAKLKDLANYIEEELILTSWNLTNSYLKTTKDNGMMRIEGLGDPTHGHGGFSFVKLPMKQPNAERVVPENDPSKYLPNIQAVTGTDADLRKLTKQESMRMLRKHGFTDEGLLHKGRWDLVDMLRAVASRTVKEGNKGNIGKFARGVRMNTKMQKDQCQETIDKIFLDQVRLLGEIREYHDYAPQEHSNPGPELLANIDKRLNGARTNNSMDLEENEELYTGPLCPRQPYNTVKPRRPALKRVTRIPNADGTVTKRTQILTDPALIDAFLLKAKETTSDCRNALREDKNRKNILQKLFRPQNNKKVHKRAPEDRPFEELKKLPERELCRDFEGGKGAARISCGVCGAKGHMKTNRKKCPMYSAYPPESYSAESEGIIKTSGTVISLVRDKLEQAAPKRKEDKLLLDDYTRQRTLPSRRRAVLQENPYETICIRLMNFDQTGLFRLPVKKEQYPDYHGIIKRPVDLGRMCQRSKRWEYVTAQAFVDDLQTMVENSAIYNGKAHDVTQQAEDILQEGLRLLREKELLVEIPEG